MFVANCFVLTQCDLLYLSLTFFSSFHDHKRTNHPPLTLKQCPATKKEKRSSWSVTTNNQIQIFSTSPSNWTVCCKSASNFQQKRKISAKQIFHLWYVRYMFFSFSTSHKTFWFLGSTERIWNRRKKRANWIPHHKKQRPRCFVTHTTYLAQKKKFVAEKESAVIDYYYKYSVYSVPQFPTSEEGQHWENKEYEINFQLFLDKQYFLSKLVCYTQNECMTSNT